MWWPILKNLYDYIALEIPESQVILGGTAPLKAGVGKQIIIERVMEKKIGLRPLTKQECYLDCTIWLKKSQNPAQDYEEMYQTEKRLLESLMDWEKQAKEKLQSFIALSVLDRESGEDRGLIFIGSCTHLKIECSPFTKS